MTHHPEIGARLHDARVRTGLPLREVARRAGVAPGHVSDIENGKRHKPGFTIVMRLARVLRVDPWSLVDGLPPEQEET